MGLVNRKPRPLNRDTATFRDDRLFIIACDDTYAPKQYFDFFELARVQIVVIPTQDGSSHAKQVLERLLLVEFEEWDERWMLLDTDHCIRNNHVSAYVAAIKQAKNNGINIAISRACFEVWLLLHHMEESEVSTLDTAAKIEATLRNVLGEYNKTNLKKEHYTISSVVAAYQRAEKLDRLVGGGDIPNATTTRVYLLWQAILSKALKSQIPSELWPLLNK